MITIKTMDGHHRLSTEALLKQIEQAVRAGETEFDIQASGQHDIGGPLWNAEGKTLCFHVTNAGQRVGSMCLPHTEIYVEESASADVGWLNAGGKIVVRGDAGDTTGHCAAGGLIYIGGRAGTRSGSLMKHDPLYDPPQLWVLKNTGSFSFEFMGGGIAVVCGWDCAGFPSVLGERSCVGMLGGVVYVRGPASGYPEDIRQKELDEKDKVFLQNGMTPFLKDIQKEELLPELTRWEEWHKLVPLTYEERLSQESHTDVKGFRLQNWLNGGVFSDVADDDFQTLTAVQTGLWRLRVPVWENARYSAPCEAACPAGIPTQRRYNLLREGKWEEALRLVMDYTPFPGSVCGHVCPHPCMTACSRRHIDEPIQINTLGRLSADTLEDMPAEKTGKKIAVIGGGAAGLSAAWQLARKGHDVTVYDSGSRMGGKMEQVIPVERLPRDILRGELDRIARMGVHFVPSCRVDKAFMKTLRASCDAVIVAVGGHRPKMISCEGGEKAVDCLTYLSAVSRGEHPRTPGKVIVIGGGDSGMDSVREAYAMGASQVTCLVRSIIRAEPEELAYVRSKGCRIETHFVPAKITDKGVIAEDGRFIEGTMVISAIGEEPELDFLPEEENIPRSHGSWLMTRRDCTICEGVFAAGDVLRPGRLVDAIGSGTRAAHFADAYVMGRPARPFNQTPAIPYTLLHLEEFERFHHTEISPRPEDDKDRCISCGTCRDCHVCIEACPRGAISRVSLPDGSFELVSDPEKCIGCGICEGVCPCGIWKLMDNPAPIPMYKNDHPVTSAV